MAPGPRPPAAMDAPEPPGAPPDRALSLSPCERALAAVDDLAPLDDDDMGLQVQPNLAKDSQEMEEILNDLNSTDLGQADLLQALKTLESGDVLSTGDPESIFPLSGFDMPETADSEGDSIEEKIRLTQLRLERRCAYLQRRMRMLQARILGKRVSEEVAQTFEKAMRGARKDGGGRPMGVKAFVKKVETTGSLQASASSRAVVGPKYYKAGTSKGDASKSASIGIPSGTFAGLEDTAGALRSHVSAVKHALDSDATVSSSGAESNDEVVVYNNPLQQHMPIEKRALWSWQRARASIASRWCWLQAQVQELEYKIRQHNDLHKQVREAKGPVQFEGEPPQPSAYEGLLPGAALRDDDPATETCARHRPLRRETFKKRKLLQMHNLHIATNKAAKPSDVHCSCEYPLESCAVCTGRASPTQPPGEGIAQLDPGYHPVLSDLRDMTPALHMSALTSLRWFRARVGKAWRGAHHAPAPRAPRPPRDNTHKPKPPRRPTRLKRGRPPLSRKIKERKQSEETITSTHESLTRARGRTSTESRARAASFDIDNIVIPQSVAAATRPEILRYKEIVTPKWRVMDVPDVRLNNGVSKFRRISMESEEEDVSDSAVVARHARSEVRERGRFLTARRPRRDHLPPPLPPPPPRAPTPPPAPEPPAREAVVARHARSEVRERGRFLTARRPRRDHLPPPLPPPPPRAPTPPPAPEPPARESVRPYSPRRFPLPADTYSHMLASMPLGYRPSSPASPAPSPPSARDDDGSLSPLSPAAYANDDPDDAEWDPAHERHDKRNRFR